MVLICVGIVSRNVPKAPTCDAHHGQPAVVQLLVLGLPELVPDALLILAPGGGQEVEGTLATSTFIIYDEYTYTIIYYPTLSFTIMNYHLLLYYAHLCTYYTVAL